VSRELPHNCYLCDYHVHSHWSFDASGTLEEYCRAAVERGIDQVGFSEHVGIDPSDDAYGTLDYERYREALERGRRDYAGKLEIRMGVEIDFRSSVTAQTEQYLKTHEFDFVTGAVHYLGGEILWIPEIFETRPWREVWRDYFAEVLCMVQTGLFDIIAHLDYPKRGHVPLHGRFDWRACEDQVRPVLTEIVEQQSALEVNTAGLRKQADEIFPSPGVLELYRELGGEFVVFGSDAHKPSEAACDFAGALQAAEAAGLTHLATYTGRSKTLVPIRAPDRRIHHRDTEDTEEK